NKWMSAIKRTRKSKQKTSQRLFEGSKRRCLQASKKSNSKTNPGKSALQRDNSNKIAEQTQAINVSQPEEP
ncbi:hypothetical protein BaRGS_00000891, partial [Batillaria attramentaria]